MMMKRILLVLVGGLVLGGATTPREALAIDWVSELSPITTGTANEVVLTDINKDGITDLIVIPDASTVQATYSSSRYNGALVYIGQLYGFNQQRLRWAISTDPNGIGGMNASFPRYISPDQLPSGVGPTVPLTGGAKGLPISEYSIQLSAFQSAGFNTGAPSLDVTIFNEQGGQVALPTEDFLEFVLTPDQNGVALFDVNWELMDATERWVITQNPDGTFNVENPNDPGERADNLPRSTDEEFSVYEAYNGKISFPMPLENLGPGVGTPPLFLPYTIVISTTQGSVDVISANEQRSIGKVSTKVAGQTVSHPDPFLGGEPMLGVEFYNFTENFIGKNPQWHFHTPLGPFTNGRAFRDAVTADVLNRGMMDLIVAGPDGLFLYLQDGPKATEPYFIPNVEYNPDSPVANFERWEQYLPSANIYLDPTTTRTNRWNFTVSGFDPFQGFQRPVYNATNFFFSGTDIVFGAATSTSFPSQWCSRSSGAMCLDFVEDLQVNFTEIAGYPGFPSNYRAGSEIRIGTSQVNFRGEDDPFTGQDSTVQISTKSFTEIKVADVNRDGKVDIVGASEGTGITVFKRDATTSRTPTAQEVANLYRDLDDRRDNVRRTGTFKDVTLVDLDKDGFLDIVALATGGGLSGIHVYMQRPGVGSNWERDLGPGGLPGVTYTALTVADFDGDRFEDIIASRADGGMDIFYGSFNAAGDVPTFAVRPRATTLVPEPQNGGDAAFTRPEVRSGFGGLATYTVVCTSSSDPANNKRAIFEVLADPDLPMGNQVLENQGYSDGNVTFFVGQTDAYLAGDRWTFTVSRGPATSRSFTRLEVVDIQNDGGTDVIANGADGIAIINQTGRYDWTLEQAPATNRSVNSVSIRDLNEDGFLDIAVAEAQGGIRLFSLDNVGNPSLPRFTEVAGVSGSVNDIDVADLDGDRIPEVAAATSLAPFNVQQYDTDGRGDLGLPERLGMSNGEYTAITTGDVDLDGDVDAVVGLAGGGIQIYVNEPGAFVAAQVLDTTVRPTGTGTYRTILLEDMNLDGYPDVIAGSSDAGFGVWLNQANGGPFFDNDIARDINRIDETGAPYPVWGLDVGDIDRDGYPDLVVANDTQRGVTVYTTMPSEEYSVLQQGLGVLPLNQTYLVLRDATRAAAQNVSTCALTDRLCFIPRQRIAHPTGLSIFYGIDLHDMNGDDLLDLVASSDRGFLTYYGKGARVTNYDGLFENEDQLFVNQQTNNEPVSNGSVREVVIADLDNNGITEIVSASANNGVELFTNNFLRNARVRYPNILTAPGAGAPRLPNTAGEGFERLVVKDLTSDGRPDVIATNVGQGSGINVFASDLDFVTPQVSPNASVPQPGQDFAYTYGAPIQVGFTEDIDFSSVTPETFRVIQTRRGIDGSSEVNGTFRELAANTVGFYPTNGFPDDVQITIVLSGGYSGADTIQDEAGNPLEGSGDNILQENDDYTATFTIDLQPGSVGGERPNIVAGGYLFSDYDSDVGGSLDLLVIARDRLTADNLADNAFVIRTDGAPDNIALPILGRQGADAYYQLPTISNIPPIPSLPGPIEVLLEVQAYDEAGFGSVPWPHLGVLNPFASTLPAPPTAAPAATQRVANVRQRVITPGNIFNDGYFDLPMERSAFGATPRPYIIAAGFGNTNLTPIDGTLELLVFVADPQGPRDIEDFELQFLTPLGYRTIEEMGGDKELEAAFRPIKINDFTVGGFQLGDYGNFSIWGRRVFYEDVRELFRLILADDTLMELPAFTGPIVAITAVDRAGNESTRWPYFTLE